jgi:predicted glycosyl hydrolase (DUF1957 family)
VKKGKMLHMRSYLENISLFPFAVETFGSWGPRGLKFVKEIVRKIQEKTGNKKATSHTIQKVL